MIRAAAFLACLLLAACGQRGDLYMPAEARPVVVPANPAAAEEGASEEEDAEGQQQDAAGNAAGD